jgi:hypothetical protein
MRNYPVSVPRDLLVDRCSTRDAFRSCHPATRCTGQPESHPCAEAGRRVSAGRSYPTHQGQPRQDARRPCPWVQLRRGAVMKGARQLHARCAPLSYAAHIHRVWGPRHESRRGIVQQGHGISVRAVNLFFVCESAWRARSGQLLQQDLGFLQVGGVKALGEPAVDQREQLTGLLPLALLLPQPA